MSHDTTTLQRPDSVRTIAWWGARVLMLLIGQVGLVSTSFFTFIADADDGGVTTAAGWAMAAWSYLMAVGFLWVGVRFGAAPALRNVGFVLAVSQLAFGGVKAVWYDDAFLPVAVVDVLILALLALGKRR
ncbi:hypothetical protein [Streptomyces sp. NPDC026673]|uniref:hypothetical protein n=1 Tax=Streptomyces sp. NPDC026673 TaxID=3155724 RepID=UPI0033EAF76F